MNLKKNVVAVCVSILIITILLYVIYGFNITLMNISNVLFFTGALYFFPAIVIVSGSTNLFYSLDYAKGRFFNKNKGENSSFKTFKDYRDFKENQKQNIRMPKRGLFMLILGGTYVGASLVIGFIC